MNSITPAEAAMEAANMSLLSSFTKKVMAKPRHVLAPAAELRMKPSATACELFGMLQHKDHREVGSERKCDVPDEQEASIQVGRERRNKMGTIF
mmetsp:Transcript_13272/g.30534  ORF Transcript_13272/g.30534 Transcript_13272/m.30534 type:complete len:94 (+) Transcript_13272:979-1260(+)